MLEMDIVANTVSKDLSLWEGEKGYNKLAMLEDEIDSIARGYITIESIENFRICMSDYVHTRAKVIDNIIADCRSWNSREHFTRRFNRFMDAMNRILAEEQELMEAALPSSK